MKLSASPYRPKAVKFAWIGLLIYFASYLMRINFAVMMAKIIEDMQVEKSALAIVVTCLTVTYGAGQVISGFLGDKISPRLMVIAGLFLAAACNVALVFATSIPVMAVIWGVNGIAHSMLWPPIVRMMSTYLTEEEYGYAAVRVSWGSSFATILLYLVAPLLLNVMHWRIVILLCAVGVWQLITPIISDRSFIFVIAVAATVMAVIFGCITYVNRKAGAAERKARKAEKLAKKQALLKEKQEAEKKAAPAPPQTLPLYFQISFFTV